ncbi:MAG: 1-acyl-sn-glycerol-3-phosphate acyltransferase [Spirochaetota bacterium]|jgi:glycerol-3-phosphate O-acyltransferase|nr:1-acyl-sn-glycerol-3-phosphate acyltransferase [Spirochaetota bacterium]
MGLVDPFLNVYTDMVAQSRVQHDRVLSLDNIYQESHKANREVFLSIAVNFLKAGSGIDGLENLVRLGELSAQGHSCLIFSEHISNLDVPAFWMLMRLAGPEYVELFDRIVFIAGRKLNEESGVVKIFAEMFARIVISPKSFYDSLPDGAEKDRLAAEAQAFNTAAYRKICEFRSKGRILLVFPAGTRYRPWDPATGRGIREAEGYLRSFQYFLFAAFDGNLMPPERSIEMEDETPRADKMRLHFSPVEDAARFRQRLVAEHSEQGGAGLPDVKQFIVDKIMEGIAALHG